MSLAALDVIAGGKLDWDAVMSGFGEWYYNDKYTPTGILFDVGTTCSIAIDNYFKRHKSIGECGLSDARSNGNGSLMRIHPFVLYLYLKNNFDVEVVHTASALTHGHERSKMACGIYAFVLWELLNNPSKDAVVSGLNKAERFYAEWDEMETYYEMLFRRIGHTKMHCEDDALEKATRDDIKSSGYVVYTLEAAIWCLLNTNSYKECVLTAVNLGGDTDTVAAIAGGLAGALYGYDAIPEEWLNTLIKRDYIENMCDSFYNANR
jgi:ADP-ribosylglycohydrolase